MKHQLEIRIAYADWNAQEARILLNEIRQTDNDAMAQDLVRRSHAHAQIAEGIYSACGMQQHARACEIASNETLQ